MRAALCLLALAAYANSFGLGLALDARTIVYGDPRVRAVSAENIERIWKYDYWWPSSVDRLYRPLTTASFLFNYAVLGSGWRAASYHAVNFLLHVGNVWLALALARRVLQSAWPAFFAAAVWAVHPIGVESVANVAGRADLLAAMAVLGGLLVYIRGRELRGRAMAGACTALFAIALAGVLSKESAVVLVGLLLLWEIAFGGGAWKRVAPLMGAAAASLLVMLWLRARVFEAAPWPESTWADNPMQGAGFLASRLTAIKVLAMELGLLVWPAGLSYDRSYNQVAVAADAWAWGALLLVAAILAAAMARARRDAAMFWCAGFYGITLLPASNLLFQTGSIMAERFLYLPSVAFAMAAAGLVWRWKPGRTGAAVLGTAVVLLAARTAARNPVWRDDLMLAESGVASAPSSYRPHDMLANALYQKDPRANLDRAIQEEEAAWKILEELPPGQVFQQVPARLGALYRAKGELEKSLAVLQRAREASQAHEREYDEAQAAHGKPRTTRVAYQPVYLELGRTLAKLGRYDEAIEAFRYGRGVNPTFYGAYDELAAAYAAAGKADRAAVVMDERALLEGLTPQTAAALRGFYGNLPGGECVFTGDRMNPGCARLHGDLCAAWADLVATFRDARLDRHAEKFQATAAESFGCGK